MTKLAKLEMHQKAYREALEKLRAAEKAVTSWADWVSDDAENRLGVDCEDPARYDDPAYAVALDMVGKVGEALKGLEHVGMLDPDAAGPQVTA